MNHSVRAKPLGAERQYIYMVTIRKHRVKDFVSVFDLNQILEWLREQLRQLMIVTTTIVYEVDPVHLQLHMHCIIYGSKNFRYSRYTKYNGFRIHFVEVYNLLGIESYLRKQVTDEYRQDQLIDENYFNHHYGF